MVKEVLTRAVIYGAAVVAAILLGLLAIPFVIVAACNHLFDAGWNYDLSTLFFMAVLVVAVRLVIWRPA